MKIFGREPTLIIAVVSSLILLVGTYGLHWLNSVQATLIVVAINAIAAAINAYTVRPISPTTFTYAVGAIMAVAASYGLNFTPEQVVAVNATIVPFLALLSRGQVSPADTSLTRTTTPDEKAVAETGEPPSATLGSGTLIGETVELTPGERLRPA